MSEALLRMFQEPVLCWYRGLASAHTDTSSACRHVCPTFPPTDGCTHAATDRNSAPCPRPPPPPASCPTDQAAHHRQGPLGVTRPIRHPWQAINDGRTCPTDGHGVVVPPRTAIAYPPAGQRKVGSHNARPGQPSSVVGQQGLQNLVCDRAAVRSHSNMAVGRRPVAQMVGEAALWMAEVAECHAARQRT